MVIECVNPLFKGAEHQRFVSVLLMKVSETSYLRLDHAQSKWSAAHLAQGLTVQVSL